MLELLDQVEDVISVEDSLSIDRKEFSSQVHNINVDGMPVKFDPAVRRMGINLQNDVTGASSHCSFLVLEVRSYGFPSMSLCWCCASL